MKVNTDFVTHVVLSLVHRLYQPSSMLHTHQVGKDFRRFAYRVRKRRDLHIKQISITTQSSFHLFSLPFSFRIFFLPSMSQDISPPCHKKFPSLSQDIPLPVRRNSPPFHITFPLPLTRHSPPCENIFPLLYLSQDISEYLFFCSSVSLRI